MFSIPCSTSLTILILYIRSRHLFILHNCNFAVLYVVLWIAFWDTLFIFKTLGGSIFILLPPQNELDHTQLNLYFHRKNWTSSGIWWWTRKPGVLHSTRSQRVEHDWTTELNWTSCCGSFIPWLLILTTIIWGSQLMGHGLLHHRVRQLECASGPSLEFSRHPGSSFQINFQVFVPVLGTSRWKWSCTCIFFALLIVMTNRRK